MGFFNNSTTRSHEGGSKDSLVLDPLVMIIGSVIFGGVIGSLIRSFSSQ